MLEALDRKVCTLITERTMHRPNSAAERVNLPWLIERQGKLNIKNVHYKQIQSIRKYFYSKQRNTLYNIIRKTYNKITPLNLSNIEYLSMDKVTTENHIMRKITTPHL